MLLVLALLVTGFACWQVRVPLDGAVRAGGVAGGAMLLAGALAVCLVLGAALAFERHAALLRRPPGPEWLALPLEPVRVLAHLRGVLTSVGTHVLPTEVAVPYVDDCFGEDGTTLADTKAIERLERLGRELVRMLVLLRGG